LENERPKNDVGCEVARDGARGENEESSDEDDEDPKLARKWKKGNTIDCGNKCINFIKPKCVWKNNFDK